MGTQSILSLLILCAILAQGIAFLSEENIEVTSDLHSRKKRANNNSPYANAHHNIRQVEYVVNVLKNGVYHCPAIIKQPDIVVTLASCLNERARYEILSNSALRYRGVQHNVIGEIKSSERNIAVLKISPPISLSHSHNQRIEVLNGQVLTLNSDRISGWGHSSISSGNQHVFPNDLYGAASSAEIQNIFSRLARPAVEQYVASAIRELE